MRRPEIVQRIAAHGGIRRIHVTPFTDRTRRVIGWQNVIICMDGTRCGLTPGQARSVLTHGGYLRQAKDGWLAKHVE
jgi:hypothetical protein